MTDHTRKAFTLIELLVVIAIISILSVVVVLTLNPAELLRQSRDSNRLSDMSLLNSAISLYLNDQNGALSFNMGSSSVVYVSVPDPSATSTAGDQCQGLSLLTLPSGYTYHCAASSTFRLANGQGWIPVNFQTISTGPPLGSLPIDPTNSSGSRLFYTYTTNGNQFEFTAAMESAKYKWGGSNDAISGDGGTLASTYEKGTKLGLEPLDYGDPSLIGYWPLNEGTGTLAYDDSGVGNVGTWSGTQSGPYGHYTSSAKVGSYAGYFNGIDDYISLGTWFGSPQNFSVSLWFDPASSQLQSYTDLIDDNHTSVNWVIEQNNTTNNDFCYWTCYQYTANQWQNIVIEYINNAAEVFYVNGSFVSSTPGTISYTNPSNLRLGGWVSGGRNFTGLIGDLRIYNRALSPTEIQALYSAGK